MQSLWSRVAQTRSSCHCRTCLRTATTIIARRGSISVGKTKVTVGDIFTACYSTILATAAVADSNAKAKRREQWDRMITEAKTGVPASKAEESRGEEGEGKGNQFPKINNGISWSPTNLVQSSRAAGTGSITWGGSNWTTFPSATKLETQLGSMNSEISSQGKRDTKEVGTSAEIITSVEEESMFESGQGEEWLDEDIPYTSPLSPREPKLRKHLDKMEEMTAVLVSRLLMTTKRSYIAASLHSANTEIFLETEKMLSRIKELHNGEFQMPVYHTIERAKIAEERSQLHQALKFIFTQTMPSESNLNLILAKICYNLLVASAPPSIITYNYLIEQLSRLMLHDHVQVVIDSFLHDSRFKPTSKTIQVILNHYAVTNDLEGWRAMIKRMRAVDCDMRVMQRHRDQLVDPKIVEWAIKKDRNLIQREGYLKQKVPRDTPIFNTLINTSLKIATTRQSVMYVRAALRENKRVKPRVFCDVVTACVAELDHVAGESLLSSILSLWSTYKNPPILITLCKNTRWALRELLHLCGINTDEDLPQTLPIDVSRWALGRLLFYLKLGSARDYVDRFLQRTNALETALGIPTSPEIPVGEKWKEFGGITVHDYISSKASTHEPGLPESGLNQAISILERFSRTEKARAKKQKYTVRQAKRVMIQALESKIGFEHAKLLSYEMSLVSWYYDQLPRDWRLKYHLRVQDRPLISMGDKLAIVCGMMRLQNLHRLTRGVNDTSGYIKELGKNVKKMELELKLSRNLKIRRIKQLRNHMTFVWRPDLSQNKEMEYQSTIEGETPPVAVAEPSLWPSIPNLTLQPRLDGGSIL